MPWHWGDQIEYDYVTKSGEKQNPNEKHIGVNALIAERFVVATKENESHRAKRRADAFGPQGPVKLPQGPVKFCPFSRVFSLEVARKEKVRSPIGADEGEQTYQANK